MTNKKKEPKGYTTSISNTQFKRRLRSGCPACGGSLKQRARHITDEDTGRSRFAGTFWGCVNFGRSCDAGFTVSYDIKRGTAIEYQYAV